MCQRMRFVAQNSQSTSARSSTFGERGRDELLLTDESFTCGNVEVERFDQGDPDVR